MFRRALTVGIALFIACTGPEPEGLMPTETGEGPLIRWDTLAKPFPDLPLPNNVATRIDPTSPTGRRINLSLEASTVAESLVRAKANEMDGFGLFSPVWLSFEDPLDVADMFERHTKNHDFSDDAVYLINVTPESPEFGWATPLDVGQGNFPLGLEWPWQYWDFDVHADSPNLLFATHDEDVNGNGVLDPYEDIDFDGVLDKPNTWDGKDPGPGNISTLITFYEKETNSLILWPVAPLMEKTTYAVVITKRLKGENGEPVRSPFPYINHAAQTDELAPLAQILPSQPYNTSLDEVAFAWTFTTQSITDELIGIRKGLYGEGSLGWLAEAFPPDLEPKVVMDKDTPPEGGVVDNVYTLPGYVVLDLLDMVGGMLYDQQRTKTLKADSTYVDYWVLGSFTGPNFLADQDGFEVTEMYPHDDNESFLIDLKNGTASVAPTKVTFMCAIPKTTDDHKPPFPVITYGHGYSGAPFEVFGFAGRFAQFGYATCGLDAPGHGLALPVEPGMDWPGFVEGILNDMLPHLTTFYKGFVNGRIRDLDNDGVISSADNGGDFWSWDVFHLRDMVRQGVVDHMQWIRVLRSFGEGRKWNADSNDNGLADDLMGDFNGDGIPDMGTPVNTGYPVWGQSMGAIISQVLTAVEPAVPASTPIAGGGGLIHVGLRSTNPGVPEAVLMSMMGPMVIFTPMDDGTVELAWLINDLHAEYFRVPDGEDRDPNRKHYYPFARTDKIAPGDTVIVRNLVNGEERYSFRMPLPEEDDTPQPDCKGDKACKLEKARCQLNIANWTKPECVKWRGWRISLPADGTSAMQKRQLLGLKDGDTQPVPITCAPGAWSVELDENEQPLGPATCADPIEDRALLFGDAIEVAIYSGWVEGEDLQTAEPKAVIDRFEVPITYHGAIYPEGAPLIPIATGYGRARNTPDFRKLISVAALIVEKADPIAYSRYYANREALECGCGYDEGTCPNGVCKYPHGNMIIYHAIGDPNVSISTSLSLARGAGVLDYYGPGLTRNDLLLRAYVSEGVEGFRRHYSTGPNKLTFTDWEKDKKAIIKDARWPDEFTKDFQENPNGALPLHADPDDTDRGYNEFGEPSVPGYTPPTRVLKTDGTNVSGHLALRLPYTYPLGAHGVEFSDPRYKFNIKNYVENQLSVFMTTEGKVLIDDPCLAFNTCEIFPQTMKDDWEIHLHPKGTRPEDFQ
ncbi:hypothetical protein KBB45_06305 [Myxococcota bacterium]|nr:hypothetical protein [Myxococcota bacterium]MBP8970986.1 hypothetical protein [Myxococcota bacterium]HHW97755.1 hypothetical protein [Oligoflexales bacterium]